LRMEHSTALQIRALASELPAPIALENAGRSCLPCLTAVVRHTGIDVPMVDGRDMFYDEAIAATDPVCPAEPMRAEDPLFILYSRDEAGRDRGRGPVRDSEFFPVCVHKHRDRSTVECELALRPEHSPQVRLPQGRARCVTRCGAWVTGFDCGGWCRVS
jgi:hypothetical protein